MAEEAKTTTAESSGKKVYFAGSVRRGRKDGAWYQKLIAHLESSHHTVLTLTRGESEKETNEQVYTRDISWLEEADSVIAEVSDPALGVGYEIAFAESMGKRILCLYRPSAEHMTLSSMIRGNLNLTVCDYTTDDEGFAAVDAFLAQAPLGNVVRLVPSRSEPWKHVNVETMFGMGLVPDEVLSFKATDSVQSVMLRLGESGSLCGPVWLPPPQPAVDSSSEEEEEEGEGAAVAPLRTPARRCIGLVDKRDIVSFVLSNLDMEDGLSFQLQRLSHRSGRLNTTPVLSVVNMSGGNPFLPVASDTSLGSVVATLQQVHRVPVVNKAGEVTRIISQMAVASLLAASPALWPRASRVSVATMMAQHLLPKRKLVCVSHHCTVIEGFHLIQQTGVSGIPVVNSEGVFVNALSTVDLKTVSQVQMMLETVAEFLEQYPRVVEICNLSDSMEVAVQKLVRSRTHRLYLLNAERQPMDVLSLTDVMKCLMAT